MMSMRSACLFKAIAMTCDTIAKAKIETRFVRPLSLFEWLTWLNNFPSAAIAVLVVLNLIVHWQTLDGYFLADDFVHVAWLKEVFNGHPEMVLKNFYTTWLQTEGTNFYRPFISVTLVIDRLLFGGTAAGYHLTNLIYQCVSTIGLYLVGREFVFLFSTKPDEETQCKPFLADRNAYALTYLPLLSAMLFAVHPLHAEVVSWIIARVDSVCCAFYLLAMWLFLRAGRVTDVKQQHVCKIAALCLFVISLISKEMAVTLPPALVLLMVLFPTQTGTPTSASLFKSVKNAFVATWQMWLILVVYLGFRAVALGSLTGGYQGSIGEGLSASTFERVFSTASAQRVIFPLNAEVFFPLKRLVRPLFFIYAIGLLLFACRFVLTKARGLQFRILAFASLWFFLVMVPTIPVWNLTETLQGSRFIYMGTAPLCLFFAALFAPVWSKSDIDSLRDSESEAAAKGTPAENRLPSYIVPLSGLSSIVAVALVGYYSYLVIGNNSAWTHAGQELKALRDSLDRKVSSLKDSENLALLNLPHRYKGAHMLYNAATLSVLLAPPLNQRDIVKRVATFEPVLFGDDDLIRISRVRKMIAPGANNQFVYWNRDDQKLGSIVLTPGAQEMKLDAICQALPPTDIDARGNAVPGTATVPLANETTTPPAPGQQQGSSNANTPPAAKQGAERLVHVIENNNRLMPPVLDIDPAFVDFLDLRLSAEQKHSTVENNSDRENSDNEKSKNNKKSASSADTASSGTATATIPIVVDWNSSASGRYNPAQGLVTTVPLDGKIYRMRIHVSQHKRWLARGKIHRLGISTPSPDVAISVHGVGLLNGRNAIPTLEPVGKNFVEDESGVIRAGGKLGHVNYDASQVSGATGVVFEISRPNAWFEHYTNTYRDAAKCDKALTSWTATALKGDNIPFGLKKLGGGGFYELRIAATGKNGDVVGYFSDPIMFQLGQ